MPSAVYETNGFTTPFVNGENHPAKTSGHSNGNHDQFQHLPKSQQDILLLHGPGQRYSLHREGQIPELQSEREILIQVVAIGLNPVDWKGPDYDFGIPSFPWVNGRDFAGIVVKTATSAARVNIGDVVFGPSTDYRDIRKATYQEYLITTDFNVARLPENLSVNTGAALGVAFVSAVLSLGISLGFDFSKVKKGPAGPDLLRVLSGVDREAVPEDVREETFHGISEDERPEAGDWFVLWGASSNTGSFAIQLAKLIGLRVIAVADLVRHGARLSELGVDVLVDREDPARAVDIIRGVTAGKLRFALDTVGKETAAYLQETLQKSTKGKTSHLVGLTGLPQLHLAGVRHHKVPIKVFHHVGRIGETTMDWLEQLLIDEIIVSPEVNLADGGLSGVNDALDKLRSGVISGKRLVVPIESNGVEPVKSHSTEKAPNGAHTVASESTPNDNPEPGSAEGTKSSSDEAQATSQAPLQNSKPAGVKLNGPGGSPNESKNSIDSLEYADKLNGDPSRIKFAYWVPNVSGGLVISKIEQRTKWDLDSNAEYARTAERWGFEYALTQIRFMAGYGAEYQHESVSFSQALLHNTERLIVMAALLPGPWIPAVAAKQVASIDNYSKGRIAVNVVSGWFKQEFTSIGQWWLDHGERYRRSREFIACLKGIWTNDQFTFKGDFYQFHDYPLRPKPLSRPGRPHPEVFQGGNSIDARENAAAGSDYYFMNGNTLEGFQTQIKDVKERAKNHGREGQVKFAVNGFVIVRETEAEAIHVLEEIQGKANKEAVEAFGSEVKNAGASTANKTGMWADSKFEDLVQYNDGFKTKLIGTPEQIVDRILLIKSLGVNVLLLAFLHYADDIQQFGEQILSRVRKLEAEGRGKDEEFEIRLTGDVYKARPKADKA